MPRWGPLFNDSLVRVLNLLAGWMDTFISKTAVLPTHQLSHHHISAPRNAKIAQVARQAGYVPHLFVIGRELAGVWLRSQPD